MNSKPQKPFAFLICPSRWTFGVAWEYYKSYTTRRLEISIQIPVIALSILLQNAY